MKLGKRLYKSKKIKRALTVMGTKAFMGSVFFAFSLWLYVNLSAEYTTYIRLPLEVTLPPGRALESSLPAHISIEVKGTGWTLINQNLFSKSTPCVVDLSDKNINTPDYMISSADILQSAQAVLFNLELSNVRETLIINTGSIATYDVKVIPKFTLKPREGFAFVGKPKITPGEIRISGNRKVSETITEWNTEGIVIDNLYKSFTINIPLSDTLKGIIRLSDNYITVRGEVQQIAEKVIPDVKIKIKGGTLKNEHLIKPGQVTITVAGPVDAISNVSGEDISARLEVSEIINDSTGILKPKIILPDDIKAINISPAYVFHVERVKKQNESKL